MTAQVDSATLEKWRKLTELIISLTRKGKMKWKETPKDDEFLTSQGKISILFTKTTSPEANDDLYTITLRDAEGKVVDLFDDEVLDNGLNTSFFTDLKDLMIFIRRHVTGANEVVDELLRSLELEDDDDHIPF